jgi:glucose/arabinose dehydrogenase
MRRRSVATLLAFGLLVAACGRENKTVDLGVASPLPTPSASEDVTSSPKPAVTTTAKAATAGGTASALPSSSSSGHAATARPSAAAAASAPALAKARVKLTKIVTLDEPVAFAVRKGDPAFYIAERHSGRVVPVSRGKAGPAIIDIGGEIATGNEQGLLGVEFSPSGAKMYVNFTNSSGDTVVREYAFSGGRASSPRTVLTIDQPEPNHNGGNLAFGPDGYLYIGMGDGGGGGDVHGTIGNGQDTNVLLGKMLRIDPDPSGSLAYTSPASNPFVGRDGRDEIWAYGLRNPWRFSFDRSTKALWIGDVGQNAWEEVDYQPGGAAGGDNYGWRRMEGTHSYNGGTPPSGHHAPIYEYSHDSGNCSVTGGYVYRGSKIHNLKGAYVFADYCVGSLRAFTQSGGRASRHRFLGPKPGNVSSFGQDATGELYVLTLGGAVYRIDQA